MVGSQRFSRRLPVKLNSIVEPSGKQAGNECPRLTLDAAKVSPDQNVAVTLNKYGVDRTIDVACAEAQVLGVTAVTDNALVGDATDSKAKGATNVQVQIVARIES